VQYIVFSPKYRGKVLVGDIALAAGAIIRKIYEEMDIGVIDIKRIFPLKGMVWRSSMGTKLLSWLCGRMDGMLSKSIFQHIIHINIIGNNSKIAICRPGTFVRVY